MLVNAKKIFIILSIIFLLISIPLTVLLLNGNLDPRKKASGNGAGFSFDPTSVTIAQGADAEIKILLNTNGKSIVGADAVVSFDKNIFSVVDTAKDKAGTQSVAGNFFDKPLVLANKVVGNKIYLSINSFNLFKGAAVFGTIKLHAKTTGKTTLKFVDGETKITEQGTAQNILQTTSPAQFTIEGISSNTQESTPSATADLSKDGQVDEQDLQLFSRSLGTKGNGVTDFNKDGQTDQEDFKIFNTLYKQKK